RSRMRFESDKEKPRTMNLLGLVYASEFLSETYNPIDCLNRNLTLREIEKEIKSKINDKLKIIEDKYYEKTNRDDYRWYYIAPLLLDSLISKDLVNNWFENIEEYVDRTREDYNQFIKHINTLKKTFDNIYNKKEKLGKKPADLINILSNIAIASPANCIYRSFKKESQIENDKLRKLAIRPSRSFMKYMGQIQSMSIVELSYKSKSKVPYWKKALKYSKQGNIQAMFDEFIHLLSNGLDKNNDKRICNIYNKLIDSMELRSTAYDYDTYPFFSKRVTTGDKNTKHLRTHFAVSFTKGKGDEQDIDRKKSVRDAFNSPFRPFVLASTSIGQEGLDFHNYCRRIVHWNLPSNPIDLEQREGRINRFECLAIRQNIAKRYGNISFKKDIWKEMLNEASNTEKDNKCSDLIPFWGLKESEDMIKIERIVPMYPFSLDEKKYERLIKILSLYRLTLGQARQEELLEYIFDNNLEENKDLNKLFINLSPYYKNKK
ncbi:MAG: helicase, partial [archaeon]|nr:helicase [archaeon]